MRSMLFSPIFISRVFLIIVGYLTFLFGELRVLKAIGVSGNGDALSFTVGFLLAAFLAVVIYFSIIFTGASTYLTGAHAENWTRKEFSLLGPQWRLFPNVPFSVGWGEESWTVDVDLIAVGPYGVLVVETKYSSSPIDLNARDLESRVRDAKVQVEDNSGRVHALIYQVAPAIPIRPVIVFWGRLVKAPAATVRRVDGKSEKVRIVHGGEAKKWRPRLKERALLSEEDVELISAKIDKYLEETFI